jgi:hypothetical protein
MFLSECCHLLKGDDRQQFIRPAHAMPHRHRGVCWIVFQQRGLYLVHVASAEIKAKAGL